MSVSGYRNRIQFFGADFDVATAGASIGSIGQAARMSVPRGIATDGTHLFVADCGNNRVIQLRISDREFVDSLGNFGSRDGQLYNPAGFVLVCGSGDDSSSVIPSDSTLAAGNDDRLYVADTQNNRVCVFGVSPLRFLTSFGKHGTAPLEFRLPYGLAVYAGCLFVSEYANKRVQVLTLCGRFGINFIPTSIAVRPDGRLLVRSIDGDRVELRTLSGSLLQVRIPRLK